MSNTTVENMSEKVVFKNCEGNDSKEYYRKYFDKLFLKMSEDRKQICLDEMLAKRESYISQEN